MALNNNALFTSLGAKTDAAATVGDTTPFSVIALLKGIFTKLLGTLNVQLSGSIATVKTGDYTTQQTATDIWEPATGKSFVLTDIVISTATAGTLTLLDDTTVIRKYNFAENGGVVENMQYFEKSLAINNHLKITTSPAMTCYVVVKGYEE